MDNFCPCLLKPYNVWYPKNKEKDSFIVRKY